MVQEKSQVLESAGLLRRVRGRIRRMNEMMIRPHPGPPEGREAVPHPMSEELRVRMTRMRKKVMRPDSRAGRDLRPCPMASQARHKMDGLNQSIRQQKELLASEAMEGP